MKPPPTQGDLFRDLAIGRLHEHHPDWIGSVVADITALAPGTEFSTDLLWGSVERRGRRCVEPRAMGAAVQHAAKAGLIRPTGAYVKSARPECHSRPVAVWRRT